MCLVTLVLTGSWLSCHPRHQPFQARSGRHHQNQATCDTVQGLGSQNVINDCIHPQESLECFIEPLNPILFSEQRNFLGRSILVSQMERRQWKNLMVFYYFQIDSYWTHLHGTRVAGELIKRQVNYLANLWFGNTTNNFYCPPVFNETFIN